MNVQIFTQNCLELNKPSTIVGTSKLKPSQILEVTIFCFTLHFIFISRYCVNILTYVMFKTKNVNLKLHPLTKRIVEFKQMLDEMEDLDKKMKPLVENVLKNTPEVVPDAGQEVKKAKKKNTKKKLKILDKVKKKTSNVTNTKGMYLLACFNFFIRIT